MAQIFVDLRLTHRHRACCVAAIGECGHQFIPRRAGATLRRLTLTTSHGAV
jgi:hypothetical protein